MSTAFPPIDSATIASLNKGDEAALEQIFRSHYAVLLERALERLKDEPAAAPRLVSAVVRALWDERDGVHTVGEIEGFVNEEFRQREAAKRQGSQSQRVATSNSITERASAMTEN